MTESNNFMLERAVVRIDEATRALGIATMHGSYSEQKRELANLRSRIECYQHYLTASAKGDQPDGDTR